jgi:hypothetical protein
MFERKISDEARTLLISLEPVFLFLPVMKNLQKHITS